PAAHPPAAGIGNAIRMPPTTASIPVLAGMPVDKECEIPHKSDGNAIAVTFAPNWVKNVFRLETQRRPGTTGIIPYESFELSCRSISCTSCRCRKDKAHCGESRPCGRFCRDIGWCRPGKP